MDLADSHNLETGDHPILEGIEIATVANDCDE